ncbi:MAG: hypothetical protein SVW57_02450, partial [Thermodesulfobacteriota bacterium]|nr:hypothetical protein [Thermodesulfobacteriota bacterium]
MMKEFIILLTPRIFSFKNRFIKRKGDKPLKIIFLSLVGLSFWFLTYFVFYRVLTYFRGEVPGFGDILAAKLLSMIFLTFFFILIFSNIVVSLSTFFLSDDLNIILVTPVSLEKFYFSRLIETILDSSWMIIFFGLPIFLAYSGVYHPPVSYYFSLLSVLVPYLCITASLGIILTILLVNVFPARRTKDILLLLSIVLVIFLYLLF